MDGYMVHGILEDIAKTSSRTEKIAILGRHMSDPVFKRVLVAAYDPFVTYGLTPPKCVGAGPQSLTMDSKFWTVLEQLASRTITGNAARDLVQEWLLDVLDEPSSKVATMILNKDLRCGITAKSINKVAPGMIPEFTVMLAHKFEDKRIKTWPVAVEPKLDGLRTVIVVNDADVQFFSRTGKPFAALDHLAPVILATLNKARAVLDAPDCPLDEKRREAFSRMLGKHGLSVVLDGEGVAGTFNETTGALRRKSEAASDTVLNLFEVLPRRTFMANDVVPLPYTLRRAFAEWVLMHAPENGPLRLVSRYLANSPAEIQSFYQSFRDRGLEGAIVKPMSEHYHKKRHYGWMKIKAQETLDLRVIGAFEGTGKYEGQLGGLIVDHSGVAVRVGGGFSDEERVRLWERFQADDERGLTADPLTEAFATEAFAKGCTALGHLIEVEYHEKTPDGSLRHPRFVDFRDDKDDLWKEAA
ncbi:hypothetical protein F1188_19670 [Roseospira marina]|uniref:ATP-dependent DNA ligase family profile domain-containing protein n=1 Tax=Roseospira marina TaxID=140057 RepID=A0A5M6I6L1_9PROT|nr:hypothetical protein [Roseospira marina]KAA5603495.1 hypothetical protein F1188_19670 [Roseospira marina]MBB4315477.1 ATP-dependent DNA ligase [Roseospira marina]MBB5088377.1 ATP-dependent DNA ligase [Roseospira marina]